MFKFWFFKIISIFYLIFHLFVPNSFAQEFPLKIGNLWSYNLSYNDGYNHIRNVEVIGDTVFSNGLDYFILNYSDFVLSEFIRTDSGKIYYYNPDNFVDVKTFSINDTVGQTRDIQFSLWFFIELVGRNIATIFGVETEVYQYYIDGLAAGNISISWDLGRIYSANYGDPPAPWPIETWELSGCVLSDTTYGIILDSPNDPVTLNDFQLYQNYPNPFNPSTQISFKIPFSTNVKIDVYDLLGRKVKTLIDGYVYSGIHNLEFNADNLSSGIYFCSLRADGYSETKKLSLIR